MTNGYDGYVMVGVFYLWSVVGAVDSLHNGEHCLLRKGLRLVLQPQQGLLDGQFTVVMSFFLSLFLMLCPSLNYPFCLAD